MKRNLFAVLAVGILIWHGNAIAEMIEGTIVSVDKANGSVVLMRSNSVGGTEKVNVTVPRNTTLRGINSLDELRAGSRISLDASSSGSGSFEARSLDTTGSTAANSGSIPSRSSSSGSNTTISPGTSSPSTNISGSGSGLGTSGGISGSGSAGSTAVGSTGSSVSGSSGVSAGGSSSGSR